MPNENITTAVDSLVNFVNENGKVSFLRRTHSPKKPGSQLQKAGREFSIET